MPGNGMAALAAWVSEPGSAAPAGAGARPAAGRPRCALWRRAVVPDLLPWGEYLPRHQVHVAGDGQSVAAFFELAPVGTEGREIAWLWQARDALENALQDSFDGWTTTPGGAALCPGRGPTGTTICAPGELSAAACAGQRVQRLLPALLRPSPAGHRQAGWPVRDTTVTRLPWRGQVRRVRMVVYRRTSAARPPAWPVAEQALTTICDRLAGGLANAGVKARRLGAADIHAWLLRWFNPNPTLLGATAEDRERFYALTRYPEERGGRRDRTRQRHRTSRSACSSASPFGRVPTACGSSTACASGDRDGSPAHATREMEPSTGKETRKAAMP